MKKTSQYGFILSVMAFSCFDMKGFNPWYYGSDAYEAFALMGNDARFVAEDYIKYFPHYKHYVENFSLIDPVQIDISKLPYPYNQLSSIVPYNSLGYYINSEYVTKMFASNNILNAIEIGSDLGSSTRHIASLLPSNGKLYAVDTWDYTQEGYSDQRYIPFLSNLVQVGLEDKVIPVRKASQEAIEIFKLFRFSFDLIYVDGDHATAGVIRDLELYYPLLSSHGVICGDDWMLKTVRLGIVTFAKKHNLTVYGACNFWFLRDEGAYQVKSFLEAGEDVWKF